MPPVLPDWFWEYEEPEIVVAPVVEPPPQSDYDLKQSIIAQYLSTPEGRAKVTASMTHPLRGGRDYQSIGQKVFFVDKMPDGALPLYDKDPNVVACVVEGELDFLETV